MLFQLSFRFSLLEIIGFHYYKKCRGAIIVMTIYFSEWKAFVVSHFMYYYETLSTLWKILEFFLYDFSEYIKFLDEGLV